MEMGPCEHGGLEQKATMMNFRVVEPGGTVAHYHHLVVLYQHAVTANGSLE